MMATLAEVDKKIDSHVDVCAVRYEGIDLQMRAVNARLKRLEAIFVGGSGAIILLLLELVMRK
jgi:hypothetical protein